MLTNTSMSEKHGEKRKRNEMEHNGNMKYEKTNLGLSYGSAKWSGERQNNDSLDSAAPSIDENFNLSTSSAEPRESSEVQSPSKQRFIVFIGNLPYSTTDLALKAHFAKIKPSSVRHITNKDTQKSKGFAFLEFEAFDRMRTCLKLYHHSLFDDGQGGKPRRLNVELTAGGGGSKSQARKEKLKAKNQKLMEQRKRMAKQETLEKKRKNNYQQSETSYKGLDSTAKSVGISKKENHQLPSNYAADSRTMNSSDLTEDLSAIHPSRRKLMNTR